LDESFGRKGRGGGRGGRRVEVERRREVEVRGNVLGQNRCLRIRRWSGDQRLRWGVKCVS
jgi:hypothetical protein